MLIKLNEYAKLNFAKSFLQFYEKNDSMLRFLVEERNEVRPEQVDSTVSLVSSSGTTLGWKVDLGCSVEIQSIWLSSSKILEFSTTSAPASTSSL